jgi:hypothetical protein
MGREAHWRSAHLADITIIMKGMALARAGRWIEDHNLDHRTLWWGLTWTAGNIGLVVLLTLLASAA